MTNIKPSYYYERRLKKEVIIERLGELDLLLNFANVDLRQEKSQTLQKCLLGHLSQHQALHPDNRNWRAEEKEVGEIISAMQKHLRSRLEAIFKNATEMLWWDELWSISVSVKFIIDPRTNRFREVCQLQKVKVGNEPNAYKKILDLCLMEIIRDLDSNPRRFGRCPHCSSYFHNPTDKKRIYCSTRCSNAVRQQKFLDKRRNKDG